MWVKFWTITETNSLNGEEKKVEADTNSLNGEEKKVKAETNSLNGEEKKVKAETNSLNGEEKKVKAETNSLNGEEKKVKAETNSLNGEEKIVKAETNSLNGEEKKVEADTNSLNGEEKKVKAETNSLNGEEKKVKAETNSLNGEEKKVEADTNSLNGEEKKVKAETNSLNGEEKKVKAEINSQTNKLTLKKVNSSSKGSILKPTLNGEEEKVKEHKPSQITTRTLPNNTIMNTNNDDYKGRRKPSLNGDEDKSKTEALSIKTTTKLSTPVSNTKNTQTELRMFSTLRDEQWLGDEHMDTINGMLSRKFTKINGFQYVLLNPYLHPKGPSVSAINDGMKFQPMNPPSVQIHFTGKNHWAASFQKHKDGPVYVMDSMCGKGNLTTSMKVQLAEIYGVGKEKIHSVIPTFNQQRNSFDCGVFAIANAVEFCFNNFEGIEGNKINCVFDHDKLRSHLITCVVNGNLTPFPKRLHTRPARFEFHNVTVSKFCKCDLPDCLEDLVGCDNVACSKWFHFSCAEGFTGDVNATWYCPACKK